MEIAARLRAKFGARVEPAEERLARFVRTMLRSRMVATERLDADSSGGGARFRVPDATSRRRARPMPSSITKD